MNHQGGHFDLWCSDPEGVSLSGWTSSHPKYDQIKFLVSETTRKALLSEEMEDLPIDRIEVVPPFLSVDVDVFGHFLVTSNISTRSTKATKKIWVLIVVCLATRAIHLEILPSLDTSSFVNAFSRFTAIRGVIKLVRSMKSSRI